MKPACDGHINATGFRRPKAHDRREKQPCGWCFPDGEIDVPESNLLVVTGTDSERLHRDATTGDVDVSFEYQGEEQLSARLRDPEFGFGDLERGGDGADA